MSEIQGIVTPEETIDADIHVSVGGYYTPKVEQVDENTVNVSFKPSAGGMNEIADQNITLPSGKDGFSPTVEVNKSNGVTTIGFNDINGQKTVNVIDGNNTPPVVCEAEGEIITLNDASNLPLRGLTLYGKTTQNGTPTPEAPVPLESVGADGNVAVTVCGKNLFDINKPTKPGYILTPDGTFTENEEFNSYRLPAHKPLVVTYKPGANFDAFRYGVEVDGIITRRTTSTETQLNISNCDFLWLSINPAERYQYDIQVEYGTTATEYKPYKDGGTLTAQTPKGLPGISVSSGGNYTDENGQQWICDEIDFARGKYVQRIGEINVYEANVEDWGSGANGTAHDFFITGETWDTDVYVKRSIPAMCNKMAYNASSPVNSFRVTTTPDSGWVGTARIIFRVPKEINTVDLFMEYVGEDCIVLYQLKEEIPHDLTAEEIAQYSALHTNKPNTTVFNDSGVPMALEYNADTKIYIDNKFAELASAIVSKA